MQAQQQQQQRPPPPPPLQIQITLRAFIEPVGQPPPNHIDTVIVRDGLFRRCKTADSFGFYYTVNGVVPVDAFPTVTLHNTDTAQYNLFHWWLNIKSFLWLQPRVRTLHGNFDTLPVRTYLKDNFFSEFVGRQYIEYGMHLFVVTDNVLHAMRLFRHRPNSAQQLEASNISTISDIVPKARVFNISGSNPPQYDYCVIKSVIVVAKRDIRISHDIFARWWYRFGREQVTRFVECGNFDQNLDRYIDIKKTRNYFGLYVHDRAKLILIDELSHPTSGAIKHNRSLVLGGVFVIINGSLRYEFCHHTDQTARINTTIFIKLYKQFNVAAAGIADNINNPVIMLRPLPSRGESLCWSASVILNNNVLLAKLEVPAFGLCRLSMYEWADGLAHVRREQAVHHYHQNVRITNVSEPIPDTDMRATQLDANDQLDLLLVRSDDPALFQHN